MSVVFSNDLAVANVSSGVSVLLGNGDGTFQAAVDFGGGGVSVAVGDFNGDGKPDLAVLVSVLLNNTPTRPTKVLGSAVRLSRASLSDNCLLRDDRAQAGAAAVLEDRRFVLRL